MKNRYRIVRYRRYGGMYYIHDTETDLRWSLRTKDKARATELVVAKNEAAREPAFNLQKSRVYMAASDPGVATRTWGAALNALITSKPDGSENRARLVRFAFEYDPYFSLSIARVDPLPHQLEAVYDYFLKVPRIRFLLADDPGAGKTIMAGLMLKELKIRGLVKRTLIITPASLSFQWQREMKDKFREDFEVIRSDKRGCQLQNELRIPRHKWSGDRTRNGGRVQQVSFFRFRLQAFNFLVVCSFREPVEAGKKVRIKPC